MDEVELRRREDAEAAAWESARKDPQFIAETTDLEAAFAPADRESWPE